MNTAELTALNTETLAEIRLERTLANIARRAETLLSSEGGYTVNFDGRLDPIGVNYVHGPQGQMYRVDLWDGSEQHPMPAHSCTCPAFAEYGLCKHYLAVKRLAAEEAEAARHDAEQLDADAFRFYVSETAFAKAA